VRSGHYPGTGILFKQPNPTESRLSDLIGLCRQHTKPAPQHTRKGREDKGTPTGEKEQLVLSGFRHVIERERERE
jgi:hypothetical protein